MSRMRGPLIYRETDVVDLADLSQEFLRPERIKIQLDRNIRVLPIDIGCLAYSRRGKPKNIPTHRWCISVDESSFIEGRRHLLRRIFDLLWRYDSQRSVENMCAKITLIMHWCDSNDHYSVFLDPRHTSDAYRDYTQHLHDLIAHDKIKPITASGLQRVFVRLVEITFPQDYLHIINSGTSIKGVRRGGRPPREIHVASYIKTCLVLARGLTKFVIKNEKFPCTLSFDGYEAVIFPSNSGVFSPFMDRSSFVYNVPERRLSTLAEYLLAAGSNSARAEYYAESAIALCRENMDGANSNPRSEYRIRLAVLATKAYACIFIALTGATPSEFVQFDYEEALEIERSLVKKELSAIKFRAKGKKTRYAIGRSTGLGLLREYLELRKWLLDGKEFDKLFFQLEIEKGKYTGGVRQLKSSFASRFFDSISGTYLDPQIPSITSRPMRRYKSVVLHSLGLSPTVVAEVLNHTTSTNVTDYAQATVEQQESELQVFWSSVRKASEIVRDRGTVATVSTGAGSCSKYNDPSPDISLVDVMPNCKNQYGCLFCKHYLCHADEEDLRKLLSLQYVVNSIRDGAPDLDHAEALFKRLSIRIGFILEAISARSSEKHHLVLELKRRVHDLGELTPFWESRLQRYEKMGVVF